MCANEFLSGNQNWASEREVPIRLHIPRISIYDYDGTHIRICCRRGHMPRFSVRTSLCHHRAWNVCNNPAEYTIYIILASSKKKKKRVGDNINNVHMKMAVR